MKQNNILAHAARVFCGAVLLLVLGFVPAQAQTVQEGAQPAQPAAFEVQARAADSVTLMAGRTPVYLWGIEPLSGVNGAMQLRARTVLDNEIAGRKVRCETKSQADGKLQAQCVNARDQDLSLLMLQQGFATADRKVVLGSVFEQAYIQAEMQAQKNALGIWGASSSGESSSGVGAAPLVVLGVVLILVMLGGFALLAALMKRGFQKVMDVQNANLDLMKKESDLRKKEQEVVSVMINSELKTNKAKIEAYLAVYEEVMRSLGDQNKTPKYKTAGDIIQKQPALNRSVFDRNTDKLDVLGRDLASALIHFYARIKTSPEYTNLEPEMEIAEAKRIVQDALRNAGQINELADELLESFLETGLVDS